MGGEKERERDAQHNTTQHNTTQHNTTQHNTTQRNATQRNATQRNAAQRNTTQRNATQHTHIHVRRLVRTHAHTQCVWVRPCVRASVSPRGKFPKQTCQTTNSIVWYGNTRSQISMSILELHACITAHVMM